MSSLPTTPPADDRLAAAPFSGPEEHAMRQALDQAQNAWLVGEVPVGAVILRDDADGVPRVLATGYNRPITTSDPTAHAELVALRHAAELVGNYRLPECTLVVTLEPCAMCAMALMHARFRRVVFGARDPKTGAAGSVIDLFSIPQLNHHTDVVGGCLEADCGQVLRDFFAQRRAEHRARVAARRAAVDEAEDDAAVGPAPAAAVDFVDPPEIPVGLVLDAGGAPLDAEAIPVGTAIELDAPVLDSQNSRGATR